jgi:predicted Fe-S protein YdhL (DUF1289 family)
MIQPGPDKCDSFNKRAAKVWAGCARYLAGDTKWTFATDNERVAMHASCPKRVGLKISPTPSTPRPAVKCEIDITFSMDFFQCSHGRAQCEGVGKPPRILGAPPKRAVAKTSRCSLRHSEHPVGDRNSRFRHPQPQLPQLLQDEPSAINTKNWSSRYEERRHCYMLLARMPYAPYNISAKVSSKWLQSMLSSNQSFRAPFGQDWLRKQSTARSNGYPAYDQLQFFFCEG